MHWYHSLEFIELQTPSRSVGIEYETEARYRKEGARFIMELGNKLGLKYLTMATGIVFYHRFYMYHSFKEFSRWITGATCLFLAGKVEETPKKCRDILKFAQQSLSDHHFKTFGENPREEVMIFERILLQTIKFDLQTSHPYQYLLKYAKGLKGEKAKINELVQKAWIFINDSLSTTLCLVYQPQVVALAVILLAVKLSNQNIKDFIPKTHTEWWKSFYLEAEETDLEDICGELMNMYEGKAPKRRFPKKHGERVKMSETSATNSPVPPDSPQPKKQKTSVSALSATVTTTSAETTAANVSSTTTSLTTFSTTSVTQSVVLSTTKVTKLKDTVQTRKQTKTQSSDAIAKRLSQTAVSQEQFTPQTPLKQTPVPTPQKLPTLSTPQKLPTQPTPQKLFLAPTPQKQSLAPTPQKQALVPTPQKPPTVQSIQVQRTHPASVQPHLTSQAQSQYRQQLQQQQMQQMQQQQLQQQQISHANSQQAAQQPARVTLQETTSQSSQPAAPILDHMSSFFQSNQSYNAFQSFPHQTFTPAFPQGIPQPPLPHGLPQPPLPQGLPQPPQFTTINTFSQPNFVNLTPPSQRNLYIDPSNQNQAVYGNYNNLQPPLMLQQANIGAPPPHPLPPTFRAAPWLQ